MSNPYVSVGTIMVFTDVLCGWSTVALHHLYRERSAMDGEACRVDHQLLLLEDIHRRPHDLDEVERIKDLLGAHTDFPFRPWCRPIDQFPCSSMLANEAVHAAKAQSQAAAEELDMALRLAFWRDSCCVSMLHEILDVARGCSEVDFRMLREALRDGRARGQMLSFYDEYGAQFGGAEIHFPHGPPLRFPVMVDGEIPPGIDIGPWSGILEDAGHR